VTPEAAALGWAAGVTGCRDLAVVRGLREGGSPWLLRADGRGLVLRVDWDDAGAGAPGVDLGSLRCDAAICHGIEATVHLLSGWEQEAGRAAEDVAYWDVVGALSTPPDIGWFAAAIGDQGRPDLDRATLLRRRDAFLGRALDRLR
jgi:hypothetical protein